MTKGNRIKTLREHLGMSQVELAQIINVSKQTLYKYENDIITNIPSDKIEAIAKATHSSPQYIMGWEVDVTPSFSDEDYEKYGLHPIETRYIPVIGRIACGNPTLANEEVEYITVKDAPQHADCALIANGDSMINARIQDGDYVYIHEQSVVKNGEIAAVEIDGETTLKRFYFDEEKQTITLMAENPKYPPLIYSGPELENIKIIGKALIFQSPVR